MGELAEEMINRMMFRHPRPPRAYQVETDAETAKTINDELAKNPRLVRMKGKSDATR